MRGGEEGQRKERWIERGCEEMERDGHEAVASCEQSWGGTQGG